MRSKLEQYSQRVRPSVSRGGHPRRNFFFLAYLDLQSHPCPLMQRHQVLPKALEYEGKYLRKQDIATSLRSNKLTRLLSRDVHPLPLIPTFIPSFHDIRSVGSTTAPKVMTPEPSEKSQSRYSQRKVEETVETRQVEIQVSSEAQKWKGI